MTAIYAGSFDPFTYGHLYIAQEAAKIFDSLVIVCAVNRSKTPRFDRVKMRDAIDRCLRKCGFFNVEVITSSGLTADVAAQHDAQYLIRGLRNTMDFMYEEEIAKFNSSINPALKTIYIRAKDDVISSSVVKELLDHGKNVSAFVPNEVLTGII